MPTLSTLYPQFSHTLEPEFHTHLTIPVDFFSEYIQGRCGKETATLKSDASDLTWQVKMTGRRLSSGWEEFAVAHGLQIGNVVSVRYEGDMVFHVSDLGPNSGEIPAPFSNNIDTTLLKKKLHPRTQVDDGDGEFPGKKKAKKNNPGTEADNSCFVALVTSLSLRTDTLYLPQHFTSSNGLPRKCGEIVLKDEGKRSWTLNLRFDKSSDTFHVRPGWRNFCDEHGEKVGGFFMFKLEANGETPVLSFGSTESNSDRTQREYSEASGRKSLPTEHSSSEEEKIEEESSEDEFRESLMEIEKKKSSPRRKRTYSSYSPMHMRFVTFTLPPEYVKIGKLNFPKQFAKENGISKPGEIYLLGKDGTKQLVNLVLDKKGTMSLGKGWKDFVKANGLEKGFMLKFLNSEDTTPLLSLCCADSSGDREQEEFSKAIAKGPLSTDPSKKDKISKESSSWEREKNHLRWRDSTASSQIVTLTISASSVRQGRLKLSKIFTRVNEIKPGMIILLGKDGMRQQTSLLIDKSNGVMYLGKGWKDFVAANGLETGDSFRLKLNWEGTTPVLSLCPGGECLEASVKESLPIEPSSREKIIKEESISWERETNDLKSKAKKRAASTSPNQSRFVTLTPTHDSLRNGRLVSSSPKTSEKESTCSEAKRSDSTSPNQYRFVTLTLTAQDIRECKLDLPSQFMRANGIKRLGRITMLGKDGLEWLACLLSKDGNVALGCGWKDFCEANGVKTGETFTLEFISEKNTDIVLKFWSQVERPNT